MAELVEIGVKIFNFCKNCEKCGSKYRIAKKSGEIGDFESGVKVKNRETPNKIMRVDRYAVLIQRLELNFT